MLRFSTRTGIVALVLALTAVSHSAVAQTKPAAAKPQMSVYKTPTCGCCGKWVEKMQTSGFNTSVTDMEDVGPIKTKHGLPPRLASCHTTLVGGYVIEGHVPAEDIKRLLRERPAGIVGLAAPGMPAGSPGMDVPNSPAYDVLAFDKTGKTRVYATHAPR